MNERPVLAGDSVIGMIFLAFLVAK